MECIFCKIMNNEIPSYTIYEDELIRVFLDINPVTNGDTLIAPKKHFENIFDISDEMLLHIHKVSKDIYKLYKKKLAIDGLTLAQNNEYGQDIKHYHLHLTPRYTNDQLEHSFNKDDIKNLQDIFNQIKKEE